MIELNNTLQPKRFKILLIGDKCYDVYQYVDIVKISPEAPVPVVKIVEQTKLHGMAANVFSNLENLNCSVTFMHGNASTKTRIIDRNSGYHLLRMDDDVVSDHIAIEKLARFDFSEYDAIVVSDYNKGTVSYELVEYVRAVYSGPVFVDTKKVDLARFNGCYVKINEQEYLARLSVNDKLIVTLGEKGAIYKSTDNDRHYPALKSIKVIDICGAGDTFLAALVYKFLDSGGSMDQSIEFANRAACITVQHVGCYAPTLEEIA